MGMAILGMLPLILFQASIWHSLYGVWYFNGYAANHEGFAFNAANLMLFLFSTQKGFLLWHPVVILAVLGLLTPFLAAGAASLRFVAFSCLVLIVVTVLLYGSWSFWSLGNAYGARWTADLFWVWAFGLACLFSSARSAFRATAIAAVCLAMVSVLWIGGQIANRVPLDDQLDITFPHWGRVQLP